MPGRMPTPLAQAFVICRQIYEDTRTREFILIGPLNELVMPSVPCLIRVSVYVHLSGGHGTYRMTLLLRDSDDMVASQWDLPVPIDLPDPLKPRQLGLYDFPVEINKPGKYEMTLLANGEQTAQQSIVFLPPAGRT
jgi:hypothetical protein